MSNRHTSLTTRVQDEASSKRQDYSSCPTSSWHRSSRGSAIWPSRTPSRRLLGKAPRHHLGARRTPSSTKNGSAGRRLSYKTIPRGIGVCGASSNLQDYSPRRFPDQDTLFLVTPACGRRHATQRTLAGMQCRFLRVSVELRRTKVSLLVTESVTGAATLQRSGTLSISRFPRLTPPKGNPWGAAARCR